MLGEVVLHSTRNWNADSNAFVRIGISEFCKILSFGAKGAQILPFTLKVGLRIVVKQPDPNTQIGGEKVEILKFLPVSLKEVEFDGAGQVVGQVAVAKVPATFKNIIAQGISTSQVAVTKGGLDGPAVMKIPAVKGPVSFANHRDMLKGIVDVCKGVSRSGPYPNFGTLLNLGIDSCGQQEGEKSGENGSKMSHDQQSGRKTR